MKLHMLTAALVAAVFSVQAPAAVDEAQMADFEAECKKYAAEDGVTKEEMDAYVAQCVKDMASYQGEAGGEAPEGSE